VLAILLFARATSWVGCKGEPNPGTLGGKCKGDCTLECEDELVCDMSNDRCVEPDVPYGCQEDAVPSCAAGSVGFACIGGAMPPRVCGIATYPPDGGTHYCCVPGDAGPDADD